MRVDRLIQLKADEEILEVVHEDIFAHGPKFGLLFLWVVIPFFFLFPLFRMGWIGVLIFIALVGAALFVFFRSYLKWSHTLLVVTDRRVIDIEQRSLFDRVVTEMPYTRVDEVSYRVKGVLPTIFRYGIIQLKLSGSAANIDFQRVRAPSRVHDLLNDLISAAKGEERDGRDRKLKELGKTLSPDEMEAILGQVRKREREEAVRDVFEEKND